jgi:hypothetical protein
VLAKQFSTTPAYAEALGASKAGMRRVFTTLQASERVPRGAVFDMGRFVDPGCLVAAR